MTVILNPFIKTTVVSPNWMHTARLCEVRLSPERSRVMPFVAQEDSAPQLGSLLVRRQYGDTTLREWVRIRMIGLALGNELRIGENKEPCCKMQRLTW